MTDARSSTPCWSPTAARSRAASSARCGASASAPSPSTATPTPTRRTCARPTPPCASAPRPQRSRTSTSTRSSPPRARRGAQAIHPGYGFLSENAAFAARVRGRGHRLHRSGRARARRSWATRSARRRTCTAHGVPVVPGIDATGLSDDADRRGRGRASATRCSSSRPPAAAARACRSCATPAELPDALASARRVAAAAFGDDTLLLERLIERPRHIEVQVLGGRARHRHPPRRARVHAAAPPPEGHRGGAVAAPRRRDPRAPRRGRLRGRRERRRTTARARSSSSSPPTRPDEFFFIEMNTRLQVEHPGHRAGHRPRPRRAAAAHRGGRAARPRQDDIVLRGHAIEARVYAESPARGFLPATGTVLAVRAARPGVRVDAAVETGSSVTGRLRPDDREGDRLRRRPQHGARAAWTTRSPRPSCSASTRTSRFLRLLLADPSGARRATSTPG